MYSGLKQLERYTLTAALALGLVGITGSARAAWAGQQMGSQNSSQPPASDQTATPNPQDNADQPGATGTQNPSDQQAPEMNNPPATNPPATNQMNQPSNETNQPSGQMNQPSSQANQPSGSVTVHHRMHVVAMRPHTAAEIRHIQRTLRAEGFYHGRIDGVAGPGTRAALRRFQRANGLPATGLLNHRTVATISVTRTHRGEAARLETMGGAAALHSRMTVRHVQRILRSDGYYHGRVTGISNPGLSAAIRRFQRDNGLVVTGRLNRSTLSKLGVGNLSGTAARTQTATPGSNMTMPSQGYQQQQYQQPQSQSNMPSTQPNTSAQPNTNPSGTASREDMSNPNMAQPNITSTTVRTVQRNLQQQGFYNGPINGTMTSDTQDAIRKFQSSNNLSATGALDQPTLNLLGIQ